MNPLKLPRVKPGDPITAQAWNTLIEAAQAVQVVLGNGSGISGGVGPGGTHLEATVPLSIWAQLSNYGNDTVGYYWYERIPDPADPGGWIQGDRSGGNDNVDTAYNTLPGVTIKFNVGDPSPGPIVRLTLGPDNVWHFTYNDCGVGADPS